MLGFPRDGLLNGYIYAEPAPIYANSTIGVYNLMLFE